MTMAETIVTGSAAGDARAGLEQGYTLPADWYTDPAVFAEEERRIFSRSWQYVGLTEHVAEPGSFFTCRAGRTPLIVVRDNDGELRALINVCRHRGSEILSDACGVRKALQCPYHAWTYGLNGELKAAPGMREEVEFDRGEFGLLQARLETWGPFIFVSPDPDAASLSSVLGKLPEMTAASGLRLNDVRRRVHNSYEINANWKIVVDNYLECYHCPTAHPGFSALIDTNDYVISEYEYFSTQIGSLNEEKAAKAQLYDTSGEVKGGFYAFLWPNFTINVYPGPGMLSINLFQPVAFDRTKAIFEYCFVDEVGKKDEEDFVRFINQVQLEDVVLCEGVQRGMSSGYLERGKLMLKQESALRHFQHLVARHMAE
jgi:phenylpropionate dioxygenase-like ring-hydroxylating dioxygenase large terminal subunit